MSGAGSDVASAIASEFATVRVVDVSYAPDGIGTGWRAEMQGNEWELLDAMPRQNREMVTRVTLATNEQTGVSAP